MADLITLCIVGVLGICLIIFFAIRHAHKSRMFLYKYKSESHRIYVAMIPNGARLYVDDKLVDESMKPTYNVQDAASVTHMLFAEVDGMNIRVRVRFNFSNPVVKMFVNNELVELERINIEKDLKEAKKEAKTKVKKEAENDVKKDDEKEDEIFFQKK